MKKRLLALLLAGLITATLVSCSTERGREDDTNNPVGTEADQTRPEDDTDDPLVATWTDADENVLVTADSLTLTPVDGGATVKASKLEKLHRVAVSNLGQSKVEKDGKVYIADSAKLTTDDLLGEKFTALSAEKTMYAKSSVNVRSYASAASGAGNIVSGLKINDTVTVVATGTVGGTEWSKIKIVEDGETSYCFVASSYLSDKKVEDPDGIDYSSYFTSCADTTMYVVVESSLTMRKNANFNASVVTYLKPDAKVIVTATGDVDGVNWSYIKIADEVNEGDTQTYTKGYVVSHLLSYVKGGVALTLDDMIKLYSDFTPKKTAETMYVSADSLNVRSTPEFPEDNGNVLAEGLKKKDQVKVVATGVVDGTDWAMIEYETGKFAFVSLSYLTVDPDGNRVESLDTLTQKYGFTKLETPKTYYAKGKVNCRTTPSNSGTAKELQANDKITVYATGEKDGADWYLFQVEGSVVYYFAGTSFFTESVG